MTHARDPRNQVAKAQKFEAVPAYTVKLPSQKQKQLVCSFYLETEIIKFQWLEQTEMIRVLIFKSHIL